MEIRRERAADEPAIRRVNELAFGQPDEARIVDAVRAAGAVTLSLVAVDGEQLVGHILFSPVRVSADAGEWTAIGLGPMAVVPSHQRAGIGTSLVEAGLGALREAGHDVVIVLGHAAYYPRFGFVRAAPHGVRWEHDVPDDVFMLLELRPGALAARRGTVHYHPAFTADVESAP